MQRVIVNSNHYNNDERRGSKHRIGGKLTDWAALPEEELLKVLAEQFNSRFVSLSEVRVNPVVLKMVPHTLVLEHKIMPIEMRNGILLIAISNPLDMWPLSVLQKKMDLTEVQIVLATKKDIEKTIRKHFP